LAADSSGSFLTTIENNVILQGSLQGYIVFNQRASVSIKNNYLGCLPDTTSFCSKVTPYAITQDPDPAYYEYHYCLIEGNRILASNSAIKLNITYLTVQSNLIYQSCSAASTTAVFLSSQNTMINNLISGWNIGVQVDGNNNFVFNNTFMNNGQGVYLTNYGNLVQNNTINSNAHAGVVSLQPQWNRLSGNRISNNGDLGISLGNLITTNQPHTSQGSPMFPDAPKVTLLSHCGTLFKFKVESRLPADANPQLWVAFEVFLNSVCDPSGFGEGAYSVGYVPPVLANGSITSVSVGDLDVAEAAAALLVTPQTCFLTSTATFLSFSSAATFSLSDSTSEFGSCVPCNPVPVICPPTATPSITTTPILKTNISSPEIPASLRLTHSKSTNSAQRSTTPTPTERQGTKHITSESGDALVNSKPKSQEIEITRSSQNEPISIPLQASESGGLLGRIIIPGGVFPVGAVIKVRSRTIDQHFVQKSNSDDPCKTQQYVTRLSPVINIHVENAPSKDFKKSVEVQLAANSQDGACVGYSDSDRQEFSCLSSTTKKELTKKTTLYLSETDHFTTFAVLLFGDYQDTCDHWIWPTSVSVLGLALILSIATVLLIKHGRFKAIVYGYEVKRSMSNIVGRVQVMQQKPSLSSIKRAESTAATLSPV